MAPRRLIRRTTLRERALNWPPEGASFWLKLRFKIIAHTPTALLEYPLELMLVAFALITGTAMIAGVTTSTVAVALPYLVRLLYGIMLVLGAGTTIYGLWAERYGTALASGLRLIAAACAVYAVACLLIVGPFAAFSSIIAFLIFSGLSGWRAFLLRSTYILLKEELTFPPR